MMRLLHTPASFFRKPPTYIDDSIESEHSLLNTIYISVKVCFVEQSIHTIQLWRAELYQLQSGPRTFIYQLGVRLYSPHYLKRSVYFDLQFFASASSPAVSDSVVLGLEVIEQAERS